MLAVLPTSAEVYLSHTLFLDVQSSADGHGNFTYTLWGSSDNPDFAFYFTPGSGSLSIRAYGVVDIQSPPGWQGSYNAEGLVTWQYVGAGGAWIHDTPLTFGLSSSYGGEAVYSPGVAAGPFCEYGNPNNGGWGTERFSYLAPAVVPEPSAMALCLLGTVSLALASRKQGRPRESRRGAPRRWRMRFIHKS